MEQKPSVGRIVHYFPDSDAENPLAAIVTRVWSDTCVNLHVFCDGTEARTMGPALTSVVRRDASNAIGVWDWPARV